MKTFKELENIIDKIDGKGYKNYKNLQGQYKWKNLILYIDYVQGDPFASPSRIRIRIPQEIAGFPKEVYDKPYRKRATIDFLSRTFAKNILEEYNRVGGSGKSGLLSIGHCGQEIIERNYIVINDEFIEARLEVGMPAAGRKILGKGAKKILLDAIPKIAEISLFYNEIDKRNLISQIKLVEDQEYIRKEIKNRGMVAFIANGSILPRESGVSEKPLRKGAVPFKSPKEYEIEMMLPNKGLIKGMGIPEGVTLIVGGGFHGKSTLLKAIELGIYNHIHGDGREYIITRDSAVKIKAENGRRVEKVDISPFINNLPMKQDTVRFSTENASGSTSQAANIIEALEVGTELLLIDEDTSATNFMIRDGRMQELVHKAKEPITPFIDTVRYLYEKKGVSTILVIGGSGDYFEVADHVIMMDEYVPKDVTQRAKEIIKEISKPRKNESVIKFNQNNKRVILKSSFPKDKIKIKAKGLDRISINKIDIDLRNLEQLIDSNQTNAICFILQHIIKELIDDKKTLAEIVDEVYEEIINKGLDYISSYKGHPGNMALPRKHEIVGVLNRFRNLKIK